MNLNDSSSYLGQNEQIKKAQIKLNNLQQRMMNFKTKRQQKNKIIYMQQKIFQPNNYNTLCPDLSNFISYLKNPLQSSQAIDKKNGINKKTVINQFAHTPQMINKQNIESNNRTNNSLQKVRQQKGKKLLDQMQTYYGQKNSFLDLKLKELQTKRLKIIQDKQLLKRNNRQLQQEIALNRQLGINQVTESITHQINAKRTQIQQSKVNIKKLESQKKKLQNKKHTLRTNISSCLKGQKQLVIKRQQF